MKEAVDFFSPMGASVAWSYACADTFVSVDEIAVPRERREISIRAELTNAPNASIRWHLLSVAGRAVAGVVDNYAFGTRIVGLYPEDRYTLVLEVETFFEAKQFEFAIYVDPGLDVTCMVVPP